VLPFTTEFEKGALITATWFVPYDRRDQYRVVRSTDPEASRSPWVFDQESFKKRGRNQLLEVQKGFERGMIQ